jgi:hypothetical protein
LRLEANDILVISGNSEATDLAEAKLLWDQAAKVFRLIFSFYLQQVCALVMAPSNDQ